MLVERATLCLAFVVAWGCWLAGGEAGLLSVLVERATLVLACVVACGCCLNWSKTELLSVDLVRSELPLEAPPRLPWAWFKLERKFALSLAKSALIWLHRRSASSSWSSILRLILSYCSSRCGASAPSSSRNSGVARPSSTASTPVGSDVVSLSSLLSSMADCLAQ